MTEVWHDFQILQSSSTSKIWTDFPECPSGLFVTIYDKNGDELTAEASLSLPSQCTISGVFGYSQLDRKTIGVHQTGSVSGLDVGQSVRLQNKYRQEEWAKIAKLPEPTTGVIELAEDLAFDYYSGDVIESTRAEKTLTATETATVGEYYRARFKGRYSGEEKIIDVVFHVVPHLIEQPITADNILDFDPMINRYLPDEIKGSKWEKLLAVAWGAVQHDLQQLEIDPSQIMDEKRLAFLHLYKFKVMLAECGIRPDQEMYTSIALKHYQDKYVSLLHGRVTSLGWVDTSNDLKPSSGEQDKSIKSYRFRL